jgi:ADP-heptose:LPS heptosyltransferase
MKRTILGEGELHNPNSIQLLSDEQFTHTDLNSKHNVGLLIDSLIGVHIQLALREVQFLHNDYKTSLLETEAQSSILNNKRMQLIELLNSILNMSDIQRHSEQTESNDSKQYQTEFMTSVSDALTLAQNTINTAEQYDLNDDVLSTIFGEKYHGEELNQTDNSISLPTPLLDEFTESIDGVCTHLSSLLIPSDFYDEDQNRLFNNVLEEIGRFHVCFGGIGDALVNMSGVLDENTDSDITVLAFANSVLAYQELFNTLSSITHQIKKVFVLPIGTRKNERAYLRGTVSRHPNCIRMGIVPSEDLEEKFWNPRLDIFNDCGVIEHPKWVQNISPLKLSEFQLVIAPKGSVFGTFRSKRNTFTRASWNTLMKLTKSAGLSPVIIGTPDEEEYYPIDNHCMDKRSTNFSEQFALLRGADLVISADSWHKSFSALAGIPTIVYDSLRGHDISLYEDNSNHVFIRPWSDISLIHSDSELCSTVDRIILKKGINIKHSFTSLYQTMDVRKSLPVRTNQYHRLTSFHPVFWSHDYSAVDSVLIKCSTALGDSLMITNVVRNIKNAYPALKIYVSGNEVSNLVFLHNTDIYEFVERFSARELELESSVDHVVEYNHIIDQLPEYYGGLHFMDILNNIAGIKSQSRELNYVATESELSFSKQLLLSHLSQLPDCGQEYIICGLQLGTEKDIARSYHNSPSLIIELLNSYDNLVMVNFGSLDIEVSHPRYVDFAEQSIPLREQIAAVSFCSMFISIDSAFYHVAHNLYKVPTLLLQSVTNEALIGNPLAGTVYPFRNSKANCKSCYWACGKNCLDEVAPSEIVSAFNTMAKSIANGITWNPTIEQHTTVEYDSRQDKWFIEMYSTRSSGKTTSYTIKESSDSLPSYSISWNGVEIEKSIIHSPDKLRQAQLKTMFS